MAVSHRSEKCVVGKRFGLLVAVRLVEKRAGWRNFWECKCQCGSVVIRRQDALKGNSSCGCTNGRKISKGKTKHGHSPSTGKKSPEYRTWQAMLSRCRNPNRKHYENYGGRGIQVCERWLRFENFLQDVGLKPSAAHSIDRKDSNGNYEPDNCRWATRFEQNRNRRGVK